MQNNYLIGQKQPGNIRGIIILVLGLLLFIALMLWIYSHSFIHITVSNPHNSELTYKIINQETGEETIVKHKSDEFKKLVSKGRYEVLVTQKETSYFKTLDTGSFLSTTTVKANLEPEKSRSFIGDNPDPCMHYGQEVLISFSCGGEFSVMQTHLAATDLMPTVTQTPESTLGELSIGGIVQAENKRLVLLNGLPEGEGGETTAVIYELGQDSSVANPVIPLGISKDRAYNITNFKTGFVLYDDAFSDILYYEAPDDEAEIVTPEEPGETELEAFEFSAQNSRLAIAYSDNSRGESTGQDELIQDEETHDDEAEIIEGTTTVQVYENNKTKSFSFDSGYTHAQLCGKNYLCMINVRTLTVYDISGNEQKELFSVNGVKTILNDGNRLVAIREKDVLGIDIGLRSGHVQYSYGDYTPCGSQSVQGGGYVLCVINSNNERAALYIDTNQNNEGSIDKKVLAIADESYVETVSAYKSYIYIVPDLGEPVYNTEIGGFTSDPLLREETASDINELIDELNIDQSKYIIINTQP